MGSTISMALLFVFAVLLLNAHLGSCGCFKRIFAFGDSIIDTGNFRSGSMWGAPYGGTYFHHPTGRCSDGHLIVDFYAQALGLPLLPPSGPEEKTGQFPTGANFAVLGSVALSPDYYSKRQEAHIAGRIDRVRGRCMGPTLEAGLPLHIVDARMGHVCLDWQLGSFKTVLSRIAPGKAATKSLLSESLIVFGEIGGNDYNFWFYDRERSRDTPYQYMPDVINRIGSGVQEVINLGAKTILVPGNFPIGCVPVYLSGHKTNKSTDYDQFGCLKWYNKFSQKHNQLLKQEVGRLRSRNPGVKIIYADYYSAAMEFVRNPKRNGIDDPLLACCGGNGPYGTGHECDQNAKVCRDPSRFANWDQVHMTEKAYSVIANGVLNGPYADIPLLHAC